MHLACTLLGPLGGGVMARPLRIKIAGGWYHLTSRIFCDQRERRHFPQPPAEGERPDAVLRSRRRLATEPALRDVCEWVQGQMSK